MDFVEAMKNSRTQLMVDLFNKYHVTEDQKQKAELAFGLAEDWSDETWKIEGYFAGMLLLIQD